MIMAIKGSVAQRSSSSTANLLAHTNWATDNSMHVGPGIYNDYKRQVNAYGETSVYKRDCGQLVPRSGLACGHAHERLARGKRCQVCQAQKAIASAANGCGHCSFEPHWWAWWVSPRKPSLLARPHQPHHRASKNSLTRCARLWFRKENQESGPTGTRNVLRHQAAGKPGPVENSKIPKFRFLV